MSAIDEIAERLDQSYPQLTYRRDENSITVDAPTPDGFSLSLSIDHSEFVVCFDGWHDHFVSEADALNCFAFGLSDECRLKVYRRGKFEYRWALEHLSAGGWKTDSTTGLFFFPFWRTAEIIYRQNAVIQKSKVDA